MSSLHPMLALLVLWIWQYCACAVAATDASVQVNYVRVGCYHENKTARRLPELLKNYRLPGPDQLNWNDLNGTVVKKCAQEARKRNYTHFAVQYWGECYSGPLAQWTYDDAGASDNCYMDTVGEEWANMVYRIVGPEGECLNYSTMNESARSALVPVTADGPSICDNIYGGYGFQPGWYRFESDAGALIRTSCVPRMHCGTNLGGWMKGAHPNVTEGVVAREVCFSKAASELAPDSSCCYTSVDIRVRNCGRFYVYKLPTAPGCMFAYCGDGVTASSSLV